MSKRTKRIVFSLIAVVVLAALALPKIISSKEQGPAQKSAGGRGGGGRGAGGPVAVKAYVVKPSRLDDRIFVTGTVLPNEQVDIQSETAGKIVRIYFNEGQIVRKGQLLVKINDSELQAQLQRATYRKQLAEAKENRQRQLRQKDAISQAEYDVALNELNTSAAEIALIQAQIAKTAITAPFGGVIGLRSVSQGSYISPATKIASLSSLDQVKIDFSVPEKYSNAVRPGSRISFKLEGSDGSHTGRVYAVEPRIDQATRTLQVRAISPNGSRTLYPGAFAEIELVLKEIGDAIMVPTEAVVPELQGKKVFVSRDGKAESRPVELGVRTTSTVQVLDGLADGDTVITSGVLQVKPGSQLKISEIEEL